MGDIDSVTEVLHSGYIGEGEKVVEFEDAISDVVKNPNVVAVSSGTAAITVALRLAGVGRGDLVLSTPMTCLATNEPILSLGATPMWVDVNPETGNMNPDDLRKRLESYNDHSELSRIKAILCMHWGGYPCDLCDINRIARTWNIPIIEDAAHAFGAEYRGKMIGNHSDFVCFSFQAIKYITSVDGGALIIKDGKQMKRAQLMRWFGLDRTNGADMRCAQDPPEYGYKFQMNDVNATIGLANIRRLDWILKRVRDNAYKYMRALKSCTKVKVAHHSVDRLSSHWLFTILVDDASAFIKHMKGSGVVCSRVHDRTDTKTIFKDSKTSLPGVDEFDRKHVCIPVGWWLSESDTQHVINSIFNY